MLADYTKPDTVIRGLPERFARMLQDRSHTVCFTGHRTISPAAEHPLRRDTEAVIRALYREGYTLFLTGGALGFDTLAQEVLLSVKRDCPALCAVMVIPCENQSAVWPPAARERYLQLVAASDGCICLQKEYTADCMQRRNRFMVDHSSVCVAYYDGLPRSGTGSTVRYAQKSEVSVRNLYPAIPAPHLPKQFR